jgi:hypothetical protein
MSLREFLTLAVGAIGLIWYYASLFSLGLNPLTSGQVPTAFRQFMSLSVTSIGVSLATFVGMLLGIQQVVGQINDAVNKAGVQLAPTNFQALAAINKLLTGLQWWAAGLYVLSLVIALGLWKRGGDATDPAVSNLGKSLLGLIGGVFAILLNLP